MSVTFHPPRMSMIHHLLIFSKSRLYCIWCNNTPYSHQVKECNRCHGIIQFDNYIKFLAFLVSNSYLLSGNVIITRRIKRDTFTYIRRRILRIKPCVGIDFQGDDPITLIVDASGFLI